MGSRKTDVGVADFGDAAKAFAQAYEVLVGLVAHGEPVPSCGFFPRLFVGSMVLSLQLVMCGVRSYIPLYY